ncbi:MAG: hypothetical protein II126_05025 [Erysipelotrichaceae bacterium]|nr:hypothetical protein [Erysipelotrichaceae bacterium]
MNSERASGKKIKRILWVLIMLLVLTACRNKTVPSENDEQQKPEDNQQQQQETEGDKDMSNLILEINGQKITVEWQDNQSVEALKNLARENPLTVSMSMYGGFEQVGSIGKSLPRDDVRVTTDPGDIVLYSGNQIVVFYGSNTWSYTRLGRIKGMSQQQLQQLLGSGDVSLKLYME